MRLAFVAKYTLSKEDYPPSCWWASSNQLKVWIEKRVTSPEKEGILPAEAFGLRLHRQ